MDNRAKRSSSSPYTDGQSSIPAKKAVLNFVQPPYFVNIDEKSILQHAS